MTAGASNVPNFERMADNFAIAMEHGGKALAAMVRPVEEGKVKSGMTEEVADAFKTFGHVAEYWLADPNRTIEAQTSLSSKFLGLWSNTCAVSPASRRSPMFRPIRATSDSPRPTGATIPYLRFPAPGLSDRRRLGERHGRRRRTRQARRTTRRRSICARFRRAVSPSNFLLTNPELLRTTWTAEAENLARGMKMLAEDIEAGGGNLKIRQTDAEKFELGVNMATTPGKVVFRNDLIELLQYAPTTEEVYQAAAADRAAVDQQVLHSRPEPREELHPLGGRAGPHGVLHFLGQSGRAPRQQGFLRLYARRRVRGARGRSRRSPANGRSTAIGYCVGGTLLAATLAYMAAKGDERIASATFFTTQVDFTDPGELKIFADEDRIKTIEDEMELAGYLEGRVDGQRLQHAAPERHDLVLCRQQLPQGHRADGLRPADVEHRFHPHAARPTIRFYLRNCYLENKFARARW